MSCLIIPLIAFFNPKVKLPIHFSTKNIYFSLAPYIFHVNAKFTTYRPALWCSVFKNLQSIRPDSKMRGKTFPHTYLLYISLAYWLPWPLHIRLLNMISCFHARHLVSLNSLPHRCNVCAQIFYTTFQLILHFGDPVQTFFWILTEHLSQISLNKLQHTKHFFFCWVTILCVCCMLVAEV